MSYLKQVIDNKENNFEFRILNICGETQATVSEILV